MATEKQIEALRAIQAAKVTMANHGSSAYRIEGANPTVVGRCVSIGLAVWPKGPVGEQTCQITPAGAELIGRTIIAAEQQ